MTSQTRCTPSWTAKQMPHNDKISASTSKKSPDFEENFRNFTDWKECFNDLRKLKAAGPSEYYNLISEF